MSRRGAGVAFCFLAGLLFSTRYIAAAIFGSGLSSWSVDLFQTMYNYVGSGLTTVSKVSLVVGIIYLFASELDSVKKLVGGSKDPEGKLSNK